MSFHLAGYTLLIGAVADTDVPVITDDILSVQNGHYILPQNRLLLAAAAMSPTIARAKIVSPTLRQIAPPFIRPIIGAAIPPANPNVMDLTGSPAMLYANEELAIQGTAAPGTTERFTALLWLTTAVENVPIGPPTPLRFTSTGAAVANAWSSLAITFTDTIPSGLYAAVFSEHFSANAIAHRWIFSNQQDRPGFLSAAAVGSRTYTYIPWLSNGLMGRFRSNDLPRLQVLCNAADASHEGYLWVQRIGNLAG